MRASVPLPSFLPHRGEKLLTCSDVGRTFRHMEEKTYEENTWLGLLAVLRS
jgi:hypothetical protein